MNIGILGTGMVGKTIATKLVEQGHQVCMGSRHANHPEAQAWADSHGNRAHHGTFADAAVFGQLVFNCTKGTASLQALQQAGVENLRDKILIDTANPLDFSKGMPPSLAICNTDSLGEQIQLAFPATKVVKTLNTVNCELMVNPGKLSGEHHIFMCGNDQNAKAIVHELLRGFGWQSILDLGDITTARGTEQLLPLWIRLWAKLGTPMFNFRIVTVNPG